jgi:hypothetical protein
VTLRSVSLSLGPSGRRRIGDKPRQDSTDSTGAFSVLSAPTLADEHTNESTGFLGALRVLWRITVADRPIFSAMP